MTENRVLEAFTDAAREPWASRDGTILLSKLREIVQSALPVDRASVVEVLTAWLSSEDEIEVIQAAILTEEFRLRELANTLARARDGLNARGSRSVWILDEALGLIRLLSALATARAPRSKLVSVRAPPGTRTPNPRIRRSAGVVRSGAGGREGSGRKREATSRHPRQAGHV